MKANRLLSTKLELCPECKGIPEYINLKDKKRTCDQVIIDQLGSAKKSAKAMTETRDFSSASFNEEYHADFGRDITNIDDYSAAKQEGAREPLKQVKDKTAPKVLHSILSSNTAFRAYDKLRKDLDLQPKNEIIPNNQTRYR